MTGKELDELEIRLKWVSQNAFRRRYDKRNKSCRAYVVLAIRVQCTGVD